MQIETQGKLGLVKNLSNLGPKAETLVHELMDSASEALENATETVKKYPTQTLLAGFGLGCVVGLLLRRRA